MSNSPTRYGIAVAVDGSPESDAAVRWAAAEATLHGSHITLVHVVVPVVVTWPVRYLQASYGQWQEDNATHVIELATKIAQAAVGGSELTVRSEVRHGGAASELIEVSHGATMTVVGSRGLGAIGGGILGSVSRGLLHYAHGQVAVVHHGAVDPDPSAPVLLGIDGSRASEAATAVAFDEASRRGVGLVVLHAWSDVSVIAAPGMDWSAYTQEGHEIVAQRLAGWQERYPDVVVERRIVCDVPAKRLLDEADRAQLVVLGSRGRGGFSRMLLGSVSAKVAEASTVPVVVVRS